MASPAKTIRPQARATLFRTSLPTSGEDVGLAFELSSKLKQANLFSPKDPETQLRLETSTSGTVDAFLRHIAIEGTAPSMLAAQRAVLYKFVGGRGRRSSSAELVRLVREKLGALQREEAKRQTGRLFRDLLDADLAAVQRTQKTPPAGNRLAPAAVLGHPYEHEKSVPDPLSPFSPTGIRELKFSLAFVLSAMPRKIAQLLFTFINVRRTKGDRQLSTLPR